MKAALPLVQTSNAKNLGREKETVRRDVVVALSKGELTDTIDARWYMGRSSQASVVYCSIWVKGKNQYFSGHGNASGYGYHKESAAFQAALDSAGIELSKSVAGVGDSAISNAYRAVARALGYRGKLIIV